MKKKVKGFLFAPILPKTLPYFLIPIPIDHIFDIGECVVCTLSSKNRARNNHHSRSHHVLRPTLRGNINSELNADQYR